MHRLRGLDLGAIIIGVLVLGVGAYYVLVNTFGVNLPDSRLGQDLAARGDGRGRGDHRGRLGPDGSRRTRTPGGLTERRPGIPRTRAAPSEIVGRTPRRGGP